MHRVVIDKPYQFVPPIESRFWPWILQFYLERYLWRTHGIDQFEVRDAELLRRSIEAGHGVLLTPNHSRPDSDPMVLGMLAREAGRPFFAMAAWHVFQQSSLTTFLLRRMGAFSVYREGMDKAAVTKAIDVLAAARRPLVIFPEGVGTRTNDRLHTLREGVSLIARSAARKRAKSGGGQIVVHPVAMKYVFRGEPHRVVDRLLGQIEQRLSWRPQSELPPLERIRKLGEALLTLKELEFLDGPQTGGLYERLDRLIERLLAPLEERWLSESMRPAAEATPDIEARRREVVTRVKQLRTAILPELIDGELSESQREARWRDLQDVYIAQAMSFFPADYIASRPSADRYLESIQRFEDALSDQTTRLEPIKVVIQVGEPIEVAERRTRGGEGDPLMLQITEQLQGMLDQLAGESQAMDESNE